MPNWRKGVQGPQRKYRKTRRGNYLGKKATTNVRKIAKNTILRMAETKAVGKQSGGSPTVPAIALFHNQPYYISNLLATKQGTADPNDYSSAAARVGDELQLKNVNVRFCLSGFRPNCTYRLVLFWYEAGTTLANDIVYFTQANKLLDRYNTEQISIIDQKIVHPGAINRTGSDDNTTSFQRRTQLVTMNGHWKAKRIKYDEGTTVPKYRDIGLAIVCYDSINTLQTDQLSEMVTDYKLTFKDL